MTVATRPMRATVRRRLIRQAQTTGEREAAGRIAKLLDRQRKALNRELRQSNLRKRLAKAARDSGSPAQALYKDGGWHAWAQQFTDGIKDALSSLVERITGVESEYWDSRGKYLDPASSADVIAAYETRVGRQIAEIAEDTRANVIAEVTRWYNSDEDLPALIDRLGQYFTPERAEMIARTETAFVSSQVALNAMNQFGISLWNFDLAPDEGPFPCAECVDYAAANPHHLSDDFPPLHPGDRCGVVYVTEDGDEV